MASVKTYLKRRKLDSELGEEIDFVFFSIETKSKKNMSSQQITLAGYAKHILKTVKKMPDPVRDAERFSQLHSWYKHLLEFEKMYPILMEGEEYRYDFDTSYEDKDQSNYHWRFILESNLNYYFLNLESVKKPKPIPEDIVEYMKKFPIYILIIIWGPKKVNFKSLFVNTWPRSFGMV